MLGGYGCIGLILVFVLFCVVVCLFYCWLFVCLIGLSYGRLLMIRLYLFVFVVGLNCFDLLDCLECCGLVVVC